MVNTKGKAALVSVVVVGVAYALAPPTLTRRAKEVAHTTARADSPDEERWQAVASGRVEPVSGEIKIAAPLAGLISEVLVKAGDKVSAGEPLVRVGDREVHARIASAEAQIAMRRRARNDQAPASRAGERRKADDAVADGENAVVEAQAAFDKNSVEKRAGRASDAEFDAARLALSHAQDRLKQQQRADLRKRETDTATPLPTQKEGQLNVARAELWAAEAAIEKMTVRAPMAGTVLRVDAKAGEMAAPSTQPLVLLGDISALRVRAELDERDFGEIKIGQAASVRPAAFPGREFAGTVSFVAPIVEPSSSGLRGQRNQTDVNVVEVLVDLAEPGPLAVGMNANVYFRYDMAPH